MSKDTKTYRERCIMYIEGAVESYRRRDHVTAGKYLGYVEMILRNQKDLDEMRSERGDAFNEG